ncbi:protein spitz isoform X2 [Lepeophtheirus salmonis]|uniref:protein spitz isoform X2 n=1 Tax=Lepeophtheirus salmonis TaxID=72036 RepID=UPI001AEAE57F|nr:protein spitz-like isoform X2 [Lepeophtheirus salmonis]
MLWDSRCCYVCLSGVFLRRRGGVVGGISTSISGVWVLSLLVLILSLLSLPVGSDACSSRSTPKPRLPVHSAMRPNITFETYACPPAYAAWYCLNGATCFTLKIAESILYNCECADGYMGQRCEFKDLDGSYLLLHQNSILDSSLFSISQVLLFRI